MPGWALGSWGYHGDDGHLYSAEGGNSYGPIFTTGDVVGCCIDFENQLIFYTKNGELLDVAFTDISFDEYEKPGKDDIYPTIGLHSVGEHVHVNFGKEPFVYEIRKYTQST